MPKDCPRRREGTGPKTYFMISLYCNLSTNHNKKTSDQDSSSQRDEGVFLVLFFNSRKQVGCAHINQRAGGNRQKIAQSGSINLADKWERN